MNGIKPVQPNNVYRVNPVNLFENREKNGFNRGLQNSSSNFNLNHPKTSESQARHLDILA